MSEFNCTGDPSQERIAIASRDSLLSDAVADLCFFDGRRKGRYDKAYVVRTISAKYGMDEQSTLQAWNICELDMLTGQIDIPSEKRLEKLGEASDDPELINAVLYARTMVPLDRISEVADSATDIEIEEAWGGVQFDIDQVIMNIFDRHGISRVDFYTAWNMCDWKIDNQIDIGLKQMLETKDMVEPSEAANE